ncbi:DNA adenine methylase [Sciscionella marina]|uniref:DNA adenine methylase n=1 Tax=Sciscionella marina TaxID=508770 RepID=UPI000399A048|nr:DNA adenine methylase [Sciscionella marina]
MGAWRPVQYLGSKLRTIGHITAAVEELGAPTTVWEPFTGSTVVAQELAQHGNRVVAGDALTSSSLFATAVLGVGRTPDTRIGALADQVLAAVRIPGEFGGWLAKEDSALAAQDGPELLRIGAELPQRWRVTGADTALTALFTRIGTAAEHAEHAGPGLLSATYAGTYFGLRQALTLEALRAAIGEVTEPGGWAHACLCTALCHAASTAVFSPGKHFAQPHRIREGKNLGFHAKRALTDRSVDIGARFLEAARTLEQVAATGAEGHRAHQARVEEVTADELRSWGVRVVYADPPYTAQQYSRFYHLLETLVTAVPPKLQSRNGQVTRGLYPEGRYLSPYCSRTKAPGAISELARTTAKAGAHLLLSYSTRGGPATGNARSVTLPELVRRVEEVFGADNVTVRPLELRYRQFNRTDAEVTGRNDPEYLVLGRASAC